MNILKNSRVKEYISALDRKSYCHYVPTDCQCMKKNIPKKAHFESAKSFSSNLAELAANQGSEDIKLMVMYLSKVSFFNGETMKLLISKMLECKDTETVEQYYNVLDLNFKMHPPCAEYMEVEYEQLLLTPYKHCFGEMSLWDYLMDCFNKITTKCLLYGDDEVFALAFKRCFSFCTTVLQMNFEISKTNNSRPLIMKCLKYNQEELSSNKMNLRKTRMSEVTKLLDMLFNTGYDFQMSVINLAILVDQIK